jgi:3-methyladenine DNA glycosylase/8-oxoguanine DNA glycosylase
MPLPENYQYRLLTQEEQDEIIAAYLKAQERDLFTHKLNLQRFEAMLPSLPAGEFKDQIQRLRNETIARIGEVEAIIEKTLPQAPPVERMQAAIARVEQRAMGQTAPKA